MRTWISAGLIAAAMTPFTLAQQPDPLFEVEFDGTTWVENAGATHLVALWNDSNVTQVRQSLAPRIEEPLREATGLTLDDVKTLLQSQIVLRVDMPTALNLTPDAPPPPMGVSFYLPGGADRLADMVSRVVAASGADPTVIANTVQAQGDKVVVTQDVFMRSALPARFPLSLPANTQMVGTANVEPLVEQGRIQIAANEPQADAILSDLGLYVIQGLDFAAGFEGTGAWSEATMRGVDTSQGIWSLIGEPVRPAVLDLAPAGSTSVAGGTTAPPVEIYDFIMTLAERHAPPGQFMELQQQIARVEGELGMSFRNEVLPAFGTEWGMISGAMMGFAPNIALTMETEDPETAMRFIDTAMQRIGSAVTANMGTMQAQATTVTLEETVCHSMLIPGMPFQVLWAEVDGHLVIASTQAQMRDVILTANGAASVLEGEAFDEFAGALSEPVLFFSLYDQQRQFQQMQGMLSMIMMPMMSDPNFPPEAQMIVGLLPVLGQHLGQSVSTVRMAPGGLHMRAVDNTGLSATSGVAVGAVLAAIAVPNYLEAQTRSKVSRVRADMRSLATGLESYYIDNNTYPPSVPASDPHSLAQGNPLLTTMPTPTNAMTTPIAYLTTWFEDPFNDGVNSVFSYHRTENPAGWILISPGTDTDFDVDPSIHYDPALGFQSPALIMRAFDPTNGTVSDGDIFRTRQ